MPGASAIKIGDDAPAARLPLDQFALLNGEPFADAPSARAVSGELDGKAVAVPTALAVCANESVFVKRIWLPTGTTSSAGEKPADVPEAIVVAAKAVRLTSIVVTPVTGPAVPEPAAPYVHAASVTKLAASILKVKRLRAYFMSRR